MRLIVKGVALSTLLLLLLAPLSFAKKKANDDPKKTDDTAAAVSPSASSDANSDTNSDTKADATAAPTPAIPPQAAAGNSKTAKDVTIEAPTFTPMLATTGTLGLFTVETGETLPMGGFAFTAFGNKFGRMPGSTTILQLGVAGSYGVTNRFTVYGTFDPYQHVHVGCGPQLSLAPPNNAGAPVNGTIYHTLSSGVLCNSVTPSAAFNAGTAGYVEDYPFAGHDGGGTGNVTLGAKYAFLSEKLGNPISFSVRNEVIIWTRHNISDLLANGTLSSPFSDFVSIAISKQWGNAVTATFNTGYDFNRDPRDGNGNPVFHDPDQFRSGAGFIFLPNSRFQPMMEYTATVFNNGIPTTPDTVFGAQAIRSTEYGDYAHVSHEAARH